MWRAEARGAAGDRRTSSRALIARARTPAQRLALALGTGLGVGLIPVAPGTVATGLAAGLAWLLAPSPHFLMVVLLIAVLSLAVGHWAVRQLGIRGQDPEAFVLDEVAGYLVAIAWVAGPSPLALFVAFVLFRFFEAARLPPVGQLARLAGDDALVLGDVVSGAQALIVMASLRTFVLDAGVWAYIDR